MTPTQRDISTPAKFYMTVVRSWGLVPGTEIPPRGLVPGTEKGRCVVVDGDLSPALTTPIVGRRNDHRTVHLRPLLAESA